MKDVKNISELSKKERFEKISSQTPELKVIEYLIERFKNLKIEICGYYEGTLMELMKKGLLEGWCWQTTESSIVFLNDDDYIDRGNLKFEEYKTYYHSWICFKYENKEYVLDPCLCMICEKDLYYQTFEIDVKGTTFAKQVKDELIRRITRSLQARDAESLTDDIFESYFNKRRQETQILGNEDVNGPMYRNNTGYKADIEDGKVKKLVAHYYINA